MPVTLDQITKVSDVFWSDHFDFVIPNLPSGVPGSGEILKVRNIQASLPGRSNAVDSVVAHRHKANFAGRVEYDNNFPAVFFESADAAIFSTLLGWQERIIDPVTGLPRGPKSGYAVTAYAQLYDSNNVAKEKRVYRNLWVNKVKQVELNGADAKIIKVSCEFTYDLWLPG
jgi:hypothetical protein